MSYNTVHARIWHKETYLPHNQPQWSYMCIKWSSFIFKEVLIHSLRKPIRSSLQWNIQKRLKGAFFARPFIQKWQAPPPPTYSAVPILLWISAIQVTHNLSSDIALRQLNVVLEAGLSRVAWKSFWQSLSEPTNWWLDRCPLNTRKFRQLRSHWWSALNFLVTPKYHTSSSFQKPIINRQKK